MKTHAKYVIFVVLIIHALIGCTPAKSKTSIQIPSFQQYYPVLLNEAQKWRQNAYLDEARIFLFPEFSPSVISASFHSPSEEFESLGVYLHVDKTITSEIFVSEYPVSHHKPITANDWKLDSQEAMEYMLEMAGQRPLKPESNGCSFIILERVLSAQEQPVIWFLSLWDCSASAQRFYLDANSGEILDPSAINVKPTRFPTPPP